MVTNFYDIYVDLYGNRKYCYAADVYDKNRNEVVELCPKCETPYILNAQEILVQVERGNQYPDFLYCPFGLLIISEKVLNDWQKDNITGYDYYDVGIDRKLSSSLKRIEEKKYYHISIKGFCDYNKQRSDIAIKSKCSFCGTIKYREMWERGQVTLAFDYSTWDGSDIFRSSILNDSFCTKNVVECAIRNQHTGVCFYHSDYLFVENKKYVKRLEDLV